MNETILFVCLFQEFYGGSMLTIVPNGKKIILIHSTLKTFLTENRQINEWNKKVVKKIFFKIVVQTVNTSSLLAFAWNCLICLEFWGSGRVNNEMQDSSSAVSLYFVLFWMLLQEFLSHPEFNFQQNSEHKNRHGTANAYYVHFVES